MSKEAMKLALEALESCDAAHITDGGRQWYDEKLVDKAVEAIEKALASEAKEQPAQQEPMAVVSGYYGGQCVILPIDPARIFNSGTALYTSPPANKPWGGLTDEQWQSIADTLGCIITRGQKDAIEAKLKEKNA